MSKVGAPAWTTRDKIDRAMNLGGTEKAVLHFVDRWPDGYYRSTVRMALAIGVGERAARAAVASTTKSGWLTRQNRRIDNFQRSVLVVTPPADATLLTEEQIVALEDKTKADARDRQIRCRERNVTAEFSVTDVETPKNEGTSAASVTAESTVTVPCVTANSAVTVTAESTVTSDVSRQNLPHVTAPGAARHGKIDRDVTAPGAVDPEENRIQPKEPDLPSVPEGAPKAKATKGPKAKATATKPESAPVWEAYRAGYAATNGEDPPRNAATNSAIVRLMRDLGTEGATRLVVDVFAVPEVCRRYPSVLAISKDPAAVRAAIAATSGHGDESQRKTLALWKEARERAHLPAGAPPDLRDVAALIAKVREAIKGNTGERALRIGEVITFWAESYFSDRDEFLVRAGHTMSFLLKRCEKYGLPGDVAPAAQGARRGVTRQMPAAAGEYDYRQHQDEKGKVIE